MRSVLHLFIKSVRCAVHIRLGSVYSSNVMKKKCITKQCAVFSSVKKLWNIFAHPFTKKSSVILLHTRIQFVFDLVFLRSQFGVYLVNPRPKNRVLALHLVYRPTVEIEQYQKFNSYFKWCTAFSFVDVRLQQIRIVTQFHWTRAFLYVIRETLSIVTVHVPFMINLLDASRRSKSNNETISNSKFSTLP